MHRSRLYALILDAPRDAAAPAVEFWSAALGAPTRTDPAEPQFTGLAGVVPGLVTAVQSVDDPPRRHPGLPLARLPRAAGAGRSPALRDPGGQRPGAVRRDGHPLGLTAGPGCRRPRSG